MMDDVKFRYGSESEYESMLLPESGTFYAVGDFTQPQTESIADTCSLYIGGKRVIGTDPHSPVFNAFVAENALDSGNVVCRKGRWTECVQISGLSGFMSDGVYAVYADCRVDTSSTTLSFSGCCVSIIGYIEGVKPDYRIISTQCVTNPDGHSVSLFGTFRYKFGDYMIGYDRISISVYPSGSNVTVCREGIIPQVGDATKIGIFRIGNLSIQE